MRVIRLLPLSLCALIATSLPSRAADLNPFGALASVVETAVEDRAAGDIASDTRIKATYTNGVLDKMGADVIAINCDVYEQNIMLTGTVETAEQKAQAYRLATGIEGVKAIYNDIQVLRDVDKQKGAVEGTVDDTVIETKIKALFVDADAIHMTNYRWRSVQGRVYLFGRALSQGEMNKAVSIIKSIKNVRSLTNRAFVRGK